MPSQPVRFVVTASPTVDAAVGGAASASQQLAHGGGAGKETGCCFMLPCASPKDSRL